MSQQNLSSTVDRKQAKEKYEHKAYCFGIGVIDMRVCIVDLGPGNVQSESPPCGLVQLA